MPSSDPPRSPAIPRGDALKAAEAWVEQRLRAGPILEGDIAREVLAAGLQDAFAKPDVVEVLNRVGERFLAPNQMGWRLPDAPSSAAGAA